MQRMGQELAEYKAESTELRNQDGIIRRLEERIRFLEASVSEKVGNHIQWQAQIPLPVSKDQGWNLGYALNSNHGGVGSQPSENFSFFSRNRCV